MILTTEKSHEFQRFKRIIKKNFSPIVYVSGTQKANGLCQKHLLSPADLLRPFSNFPNIKLKIKIAEKEKIISISQFQLLFVDAEEFSSPNKQQIEEHLKYILKMHSPEPNIWLGNYNTENDILTHLTQVYPHWFDKIGDVLFNCPRFSFDISYLEQPIAIINMVTSTEDNLVNNLKELKLKDQTLLNKMFSNIDFQHIPYIHMILCENSDEYAFTAFQDLETEFSNCSNKMIFIGLDPSNQEVAMDSLYFWDDNYKYNYNINNDKNIEERGIAISKVEKEVLAKTVADICFQVICPYIEKKLQLYENIVSRSKGFMKSFFKSKDKTLSPEGSLMSFEEYSIRILADIYFILGEYESAYTNYKYLYNEIKGRINKLMINCSEMIHLSQFLLEGGNIKKDPTFKNCFQSYYTLDNVYPNEMQGTKFALRAMFFQIYESIITKKTEQLSFVFDASKVFSDNFPTLMPILREQYAFSQIKKKPPSIRKYACEMNLTAGLYDRLGFERHSLRCYAIGNILYELSDWCFIKENIGTMLGKKFLAVDDLLASMKNYRYALEHIQLSDPMERQTILFEEAINVILKIEKLKENNELTEQQVNKYIEEWNRLALPIIHDETLDIYLECDKVFMDDDQIVYKGQEQDILNIIKSINVEHEYTWYHMGKLLNEFFQEKSMNFGFNNIKEEQMLKLFDCKALFEKKKLLGMCIREAYVDDEILIEIKIQNIFKIALDLEDISIDYEMVYDNDSNLTKVPPVEPIFYEKVNIKLDPVEQKILQIKCIPKVPGTFILKGFAWKLFGIRKIYSFKHKVDKNHSNMVEICPKLGKINLKFYSPNKMLISDQLAPLEITIENLTNQAIESIYMVNSSPLIFGHAFKNYGGIQSNQTKKLNIMTRASLIGYHQIKLLAKLEFTGGIYVYRKLILTLEIQEFFIPKYYVAQSYDKRIISIHYDDLSFPKHFMNDKSITNEGDNEDEQTRFYISKVILLNNKSKDKHKDSRDIDKLKLKNTDNSIEGWSFFQKDLINKIYKQKEKFLSFYIKPDERYKALKDEDSTQFINGINMLDLDINKPLQLDLTLLNDLYHINLNHYIQTIPDDSISDFLSLAVLWEYKLNDHNSIEGLNFIYKVPLSQKPLTQVWSQERIFGHLPVRMKLNSRKIIKHDFSENYFCGVDIKISLTNTLLNQDLSFRFEALDSKNATDDDPYMNNYIWEGVHEVNILDLRPYETRDIDLRVIFFKPDVYDIFEFRYTFYFLKNTNHLIHPITYNQFNIFDSKYDVKCFITKKDEYMINVTM